MLLRIGRFVQAVVEVYLARFDMNMFLEQVIAAMQPPPIKHLIIAAEFKPVGVAFQIVCENQRE